MTTIVTYSGKEFDLFHPEPEMVEIIDIAHALSMTPRFGGHCDQFYSVAQHSFLVSMICQKHPLLGLMHDAAEAYVGDVVSPLKEILTDFKVLEARVNGAIGEKFFDSYSALIEPPEEVKHADKAALRLEKETFWPEISWWDVSNLPKVRGVLLNNTWTSSYARDVFLRRFESLRAKLSG